MAGEFEEPAEVDVEALLASVAPRGEGGGGVHEELSAEDLRDAGLLSDLSAIGWVDDDDDDGDCGAEATAPVVEAARARPPPHASAPPPAARQSVPFFVPDDSALEAAILALADDPEDGACAGGGASPKAVPEPVPVEEVDARIAECLRSALACKQRGDRQGALGWLGSKKALSALRADAEAGSLDRSDLPRRLEPAPTASRPVPDAAAAPATPAREPGAGTGAGLSAPLDQPALGADELEVTLLAAALDPARLPTRAPHTFAAYRLSLPGQPPLEGRSELVRSAANPGYDQAFRLRLPLRRGSAAALLAHRRLSVEVWHVPHTGLLRFVSPRPSVLGRAELRLGGLGQAHVLEADLPLRPPDRRADGSSPGQVRVRVRLAAPRPPPAPPPREPAAAAGAVADAARSGGGGGAGRAAGPGAGARTAGEAAAGAEAGAGAAEGAAAAEPDEGEDDFAYAERICSFDVLTWELEELGARRGVNARASADGLRLRRESLEFRQQLIELKVQAGQLSMGAYLAQLRKAIGEEQALARQHKAQDGLPAKQRALHCLKRVRVMRDELLAATAAQEDDEGGDAAGGGSDAALA